MWLCFNDGFVSAVEDENDDDRLVVRARRKQDIKNIFPNETVYENVGTDYKYRVYCSKKDFAKIVSDRIKKEIDYTNFKNSVVDNDRHQLYADFWSLHYAYQKKEPPQRG